MVCQVCVERLRMCRTFRRLAERSDARLRALYMQARTASESEAEYQSIIPEIVMGSPESNVEEDAQPVSIASKESKEYESIIPEIVMRAPKSNVKEDMPPVSVVYKETKKSPEAGVSRLSVRSDLFLDQKETSEEIPKEHKFKGKPPTPHDTETIDNSQTKDSKHKRRRMAAAPKMKNSDVQEHSSNETEVHFTSSKDEDDFVCKKSPEAGVSRLSVRSDLFLDQKETSKEIPKERKLKRKPPSPRDTETLDNSQTENFKPKRRRMAAASKMNNSDVQEHSSSETEVHSKKCRSIKDDDDLVCEVCNKECATPKALYLHRRSHIKRYPCSMCVKAFASNGDLTKHVRTHTGEKPYVCDKCSKAFAQRVSLKLHYNIHIKLEAGEAIKKGRPSKTNCAVSVKTEESPLATETGSDINKKRVFLVDIYSKETTSCNAYDGKFETESVRLLDDDERSSPNMIDCISSGADKIGLPEDDSPVQVMDNPSDIIDVTGLDDSEKDTRPEVYKSNTNENRNTDTPNLVVRDIVESTFFYQEVSNNGVQSKSINSIRKKPYQCDICNKKFSREEKLQKHRTKHEKKNTCVPNETVSAVADSTNNDSVGTETNDAPSDFNDDKCLIISSEITESAAKLNTDSCMEAVNVNGVVSPDSIGVSDGSEDDTVDKSYSTRTAMDDDVSDHEELSSGAGDEDLLNIEDSLEEGMKNQKLYQCDTCQKNFRKEKAFQHHQNRHLKRAVFSVRRFC